MIKLKKLLNEKLQNSQGETYTFGKGDIVKDINPDCPHHGAEGEVTKGGKVKITFIVTNNGKNYKEGDKLEKTVDQMVKLKEGKLTEDKFIAFYKKDRVTVNAKSLWDAKKQIIAKLKVPKKDVGLVSVLNKTEYDKQKFRFEGKLSEAIGKGMKWEDLKVGTVIDWQPGVQYKVTKLSKNKLSSKKHNVLKSASKHIFADKYDLKKQDFEDSVRRGFIKSLTNTNPRK